MNSGAVFSECRTYRYKLWRIWDSDGPIVNVIGLNPSTADESIDDPTIRRCIDFGRRWGYGGLLMTNLFAYRSTDPKGLAATSDPVGPRNDRVLYEAAGSSGLVIAAWGAHGAARSRSAVVRPSLAPFHVMCLGTTKGGAPKHPLYLKKTTMPACFWDTEPSAAAPARAGDGRPS